ncbi:MAG TPA: MFS transporter [Chloroflexota bacterium]|nr:MFS transporter [Chloroflexota bacterium]
MNPRRQKMLYSAGQIGVGVYNGFNNAILPLYVHAFTSNALIIGYLSNTRTIEGVVIQPLIGRWSDRTTNPLGRRRPFLVTCIPISLFFLALVPLFARTGSPALPLIAGAIILFSIMWNAAYDPYQSLMIDITPPVQRPVFNAILSVVSLLGQVAILLYAAFASLKKNNIPAPVVYAVIGIILVTFAVVVLGVHEPRRGYDLAEREERIPLRTYLAEMRTFTEAFKLLVSIFFLWTGLNAIIPYLTIFTVTVMHVSHAKALLVYLAVILAAGIFAYPFGLLARRYGMRGMIALGTVLLILAALLGTVAPTYLTLFPVAILAGCGFSATTALTYPYLAQLVPEARIGVFTGLQAAFSSVAAPISVGIAGLLSNHFGYRVIFPILAVMMVADIAFLLTIDESRARRQVARVVAQEHEPAETADAPLNAPNP